MLAGTIMGGIAGHLQLGVESIMVTRERERDEMRGELGEGWSRHQYNICLFILFFFLCTYVPF